MNRAPNDGDLPPTLLTNRREKQPTVGEQACEMCGLCVRFRTVAAPFDGMPDFIQVHSGCAWLGWNRNDAERTLALVALCSQACLQRWFDIEEPAGA